MTRTCNELGLCQRLVGKAPCPDCEDVIEFELGVTMAEPPRPTHPFAPGVIQGPNWAPGGFKEQSDFGLSARQTVLVVAVVFVLASAGGYLVGVR